jgi:hypothetical protein
MVLNRWVKRSDQEMARLSDEEGSLLRAVTRDYPECEQKALFNCGFCRFSAPSLRGLHEAK